MNIASIMRVGLVVGAVTGLTAPTLGAVRSQTLSVSNRETTWPQSIGVKGAPSYSPTVSYALVLQPTLDPSSPSGLKVPSDISSGVAELRKALPKDYQQSLKMKKSGIGRSYCVSPRPQIDTDVIAWMVVAWNLRDPKGAWLGATNNKPSGESYPDLVADAVFEKLCATK